MDVKEYLRTHSREKIFHFPISGLDLKVDCPSQKEIEEFALEVNKLKVEHGIDKDVDLKKDIDEPEVTDFVLEMIGKLLQLFEKGFEKGFTLNDITDKEDFTWFKEEALGFFTQASNQKSPTGVTTSENSQSGL